MQRQEALRGKSRRVTAKGSSQARASKSVRVFLDTHIIVYAYNSAEIERHPIAVRVIDRLLTESDEVVISQQVAGEIGRASCRERV